MLIEFKTRRADFLVSGVEEVEIEDGMLYVTYYEDGKEYRKAFKMSTVKRICMH